MTDREQRGLVIAATCKLRQKGKAWLVPSQSGSGNYTVVLDEQEPFCSCPDHELTGKPCKHIHAVEFTIKREENPDGSVTETRTLTLTQKRTTYKQNWPAYNAAQVNEKDQFQELLHDLCRGLRDPQQGRGRPRIPLADAVFAACFKIYSTVSGRRFMSDLREAHERGYVSRVPCYNSIFNVLESPATFDVLQSLVVRSAKPLAAVESTFAPDSSGFSGCRFDRWFDHKWGKQECRRSWVKVHIMTGCKTNIVTAIEIEGQYANDGAQLDPLLLTTTDNFTVKEVAGDLAYSTHYNLDLIDSLGAVPLIPFKKNASPAAGGVWGKMFHYFAMNREEFLARYHQRSNVESTFSMVKAKFGDGLRSKCDVAMKNEALAKFVCHNICCLISAMHELGIQPTFWAGSKVAQNVPAI